jgi:hypothetical protein
VPVFLFAGSLFVTVQHSNEETERRGRLTYDTPDEVERTLQSLRANSPFSAVFADHPEGEAALRQAIAADIAAKQPTDDARSRTNGVLGDLNRRFLAPALGNADDPSALKAAAAYTELAVYLQAHDVAACRDLGASAMQDIDRMDGQAKELMKRLVATLADAYRNGRAATTTRPKLSDERAGKLLGQAGYVQADLDRLSNFVKLPAGEACTATVKLYSAPGRLPPADGADLARRLISPSS